MQSPTGSSGEVEEVDLSGLMESVVDSDEDEEEEECDETSLLVRDAVRECLEKDPSDRGTVIFFLILKDFLHKRLKVLHFLLKVLFTALWICLPNLFYIHKI